jgi:hypothetical protein
MSVVGKRLLGLFTLVLVAAMPLGCVNINQGPRENGPEKEVTVGGEHGVVVDRSPSETTVKIGGDRGVVVEHPRD